MRRDGGFTLIELIMAIALVAILLGTAVPALDAFTNDSRQTGAINDFVATLHLARNTAITTNSRVMMCASATGTNCEVTGWDSGWIVFGDLNSNASVDANETIVTASAGVDGLSIQSGEFARFLMYRPNGRAMTAAVTGNSGEFSVCDDRGDTHAKVILVELSGRPRLSKTNADGTSPSCL